MHLILRDQQLKIITYTQIVIYTLHENHKSQIYNTCTHKKRKGYICDTKSESESCSVMSDSLQPHGLYCPWNSPGLNTGMNTLSLLQGIFPTQGLSPGLPHYRWIIYQLSHKVSPRILEQVAYSFSSRSSQPRNQTRVSCTAGGFFAN